ncbi:MAG TPA: hypothetical protein VJ901_18000 [Thermoanaerobaculia bacterium]|nr:hypothetical protein [Thermoanaerobaculia bacterium]
MKIVRTSVVAAVLVVFAAAAQASDPFYAALLTRGVSDAQRGDHFRAVKELRIAAFGLVDDPAQYLRAQVYLANSLEKLGQHADAAVAVDKASRAERINSAYASAAIDPDARSTFEALAVKSLRPEQLAMVPSFRHVAAAPPPPPPPAPKPAPVAVVSVPKPAPVIEKPVEKPPVVQTQPPPPPPAVVIQKPVQKAAVAQTKPAPAPAPVQPARPQPQPVAETKPPVVESPLVAAAKHQPSQALAASDPSAQIGDAQRLLNEGKILAARQIYLRLAVSEGLARTTALDVAKGLNQTSAWRESSNAYQKLMPFRSGEEMHQFYEAVNHYELGDLTAARDLLTRAMSALPVTRETSLYRSKILGLQ